LKSREDIRVEMFTLCMLNQFMLHLKLDGIVQYDETILSNVFKKHSNLEFKHIIYLILHDEVQVTVELKTKIINNDEFKWCGMIERDFEFESNN
jgi:hypothetical protein